jgi:hypothetical protein
MEEEPTTEELRVEQLQRERVEREAAAEGATPDDTEQHERRAEKASYLREKLEERERAERETD